MIILYAHFKPNKTGGKLLLDNIMIYKTLNHRYLL